MSPADAEIAHVLDLERELQTPRVRSDEERLSQLLAHDFLEVGASGRRWDRSAILGMLAQESAGGEVTIGVHDLHGRVLTPDLIQVFWDSDIEGRRARRTSLWRRTSQGWQQTYHQGTPLP